MQRCSSSSEVEAVESVSSKELRAKGIQRPSYLSLPEVNSDAGDAESRKATNSPVSPLAKLHVSQSVFYDNNLAEGDAALLAASRSSLELAGFSRAVSAPNLRVRRRRTSEIAKAKNTRELKAALHSLGSQVREDLKNVSTGNLRSIGCDEQAPRSRSNSILDQLRQLEDLKQLVATREEEILECVEMGESLLNETHAKDITIQSQADQITLLQKEVSSLTVELERISREEAKHANRVAIDMAREELSDAKEALRNQEEILEREKEDAQWCRRQTLQQASEQVKMEIKIHTLTDQNEIISLETEEAQARLLLVQSSLVEYNDTFESSLCYAYRVVEKLEQSDLELTMTLQNITETLQQKNEAQQDNTLGMQESESRMSIITNSFVQYTSLTAQFFQSLSVLQEEAAQRTSLHIQESDRRAVMLLDSSSTASQTATRLVQSNSAYQDEIKRLSTVVSDPSDSNKLNYLKEELRSQKVIQQELTEIWEGEKGDLRTKITVLENYVESLKKQLRNASEAQVNENKSHTEVTLQCSKLSKQLEHEQAKNQRLSETIKQVPQLTEALKGKKSEISKLYLTIEDLQNKILTLEEQSRNEGADPVTTRILNRMKAMRHLEDTQLDYKRKLEAYKTSVNCLIETSEGPPSFQPGTVPAPGVAALSNGDRLHHRFQKIQSQLTALDDAVYETQQSHRDAESEMIRTSDILKSTISQSRSQIQSTRERYSSSIFQ
eukprot:TRINITY_DN1101_c0_g1_i1.p1 TRINITY_DN1101_c0_g1~~TRINITY_DN1101_c0_g1_i1.p1  ORF type:complete len:725 (+),score=176.96 TRINITY_DN1101_c0_g1_i1:80-2254(+)